MTDRDVSMGCVVACSMWLVVVLLMAASYLINNENLGRLALGMSAAAATATIRQYFVAQNRLIRTALGKGDGGVRNLR